MTRVGIDPTTIVPIAYLDEVPDKEARFREGAAAWVEDRFGLAYFTWDQWRSAPHHVLARVFSRDELFRLWHDSVLSSRLDDHFQEHEQLAWKVQNSLWRYGCLRDFRRFVACHNALARIRAAWPGFDVRITHTRGCNTAAWAVHGREDPIYLDASLGVLLYHRGEHVLTNGFAVSRHGVLVAQVQLRKKRGNRFLYKLPGAYLDVAIDLLQRAFPDERLHLVTGESARTAIQRAYGKDADCLLPETLERVQRFYEQPLATYERTGATVRCGSDDGRVFAELGETADAA